MLHTLCPVTCDWVQTAVQASTSRQRTGLHGVAVKRADFRCLKLHLKGLGLRPESSCFMEAEQAYGAQSCELVSTASM